jgi:hypothetical protein
MRAGVRSPRYRSWQQVEHSSYATVCLYYIRVRNLVHEVTRPVFRLQVMSLNLLWSAPVTFTPRRNWKVTRKEESLSGVDWAMQIPVIRQRT